MSRNKRIRRKAHINLPALRAAAVLFGTWDFGPWTWDSKSAPLLTKEGWQPQRLTGWFSRLATGSFLLILEP